jgi:hypothetical protein
MIERVLAILRGRHSDHRKAQQFVADNLNETYSELTAGYDAAISAMQTARKPYLAIGLIENAAGKEVELRVPLLDSAVFCLTIGGTGTGKSTYEESHLPVHFRHRDVFAAGVADFKEGIYHNALRWYAALAYTLEPAQQQSFINDLHNFNPFSSALAPFNVCRHIPGVPIESQSYDVVTALLGLFSGFSDNMNTISRYLVTLLIEQDLTLVESVLVLHDEILRTALINRSANERVKEFFLGTFPQVSETSKQALISRLQSLLLPPSLYLMLGADQCIDIPGAFAQGRSIIAFLGKGSGVPEALMETFGSLFLIQFLNAAFSRPRGHRRPYKLVCDEFFHLVQGVPEMAKRFETAMVSLRSYGIFLTLVMHQFSQVPPALRDTLLGNVDIVNLLRTHDKNTEMLGDILPDIDPAIVRQFLEATGEPPGPRDMREHLLKRQQRLPNRYGLYYDRRQPYGALLRRMPNVKRPHQSIGISERQLEDFIAAHRIDVGVQALSRKELEAQIAARRRRLNELVTPAPRKTAKPAPVPVSEPAVAQADKKPKPLIG